ncbi:hypothetical protein ACFU44_00660 [Nocardia rhizosphaerihabitans]|uniref:hypothetical protein n=1 Tax=Nocardia rhizosphaerihabitans TaxID=1691570 RepID=UPI0036709F01
MSYEDIDKAFRKAAEWVTYSWPGVISAEDLSQELWVWYLERPSIRDRFDSAPYTEVVQIAAAQAHKIASEAREDNARFSSQITYSIEDIKDALRGKSLSRELLSDLAAGMDALRERAEGEYVDAIEARYFEKVMPATQADRDRLKNAHKALAEETNRVVRAKFDGPRRVYEAAKNQGQYRTSGDGPGSKRRVFPEVNNSKNIFDPEFSDMPGSSMYQHWVYEDQHPTERNARLENWSADDFADTWER